MSTLSHDTLNFWEAFYSIEPFGDEARQTAESMVWLYRIWKAQMAGSSGVDLTADDFMPEGFRPAPKMVTIQPMTPEQEQAAFCAAFGIKAK